MTSQTDELTAMDAGAVRIELLARLGLPSDATDHDVETLRTATAALLENAPDAQRSRAADHLADIEAVQSLLAEHPAEPGSDGVDPDPGAGPARRSRLAWAVAALVLVIGGAFGVHLMTSSGGVPGIDGAPDTSTPSASAQPSLDMAQVGALMQKITADPKDARSYAGLANLYFQAGDYANSQKFGQKVVALTPKDATAWLLLGAAQFNGSDTAAAEKSWLRAVAIDPKSIEAHYDLGFLYMSGPNPDLAKTKAEWQKVVALDPSSELAKTVQTHLDSLATQSPAPNASK